MKKKMICLWAAVLFGVLFLCSCGGEDYAFTASSSHRCWYDGYVYSMNTNGILTYRKATETEESPLCFDPLCDHRGYRGTECPAYAPGAHQAMAVTRNCDGEFCFYYTDRINRPEDIKSGIWPFKYRLCCINMQTGQKTVILDEQSEEVLRFYLYGNDIYLLMQGRTKNEDGKYVYDSQYWKMSMDGSDLIKLPTSEYDVGVIVAVAEVKGRTVIYWLDRYDNVLYVSPEDFSERTKIAEGLATYEKFVVGNYLYYAIEDPEVIPEMQVKAPVDGDGPTPGATYTVYPEAKNAAYYRLNITDPKAVPELMYDGVSSVYRVDARLMWANGNKIYVIPYDPVFLEVLDAYAVVGHVNTETQPNKIPLQYEYINARAGMKILEIDLVTGERREIHTPGFNPETIMGGDDEKIVVRGSVVDMDRIRERIRDLTAENGSFPLKESYMFWEIREIDLNP